jgi:hypothetical protein
VFGKKKSSSSDASESPAPTTRTKEENAKLMSDMRDAQIELNQRGSRAVAKIVEIDELERIGPFHQYQFHLRVRRPGDPEDGGYDAALVSTMFSPNPKPVGSVVQVVFDEDDPQHVELAMQDAELKPRWKVPEMCPECGARVDQSVASMANHPTCEFCKAPLPCEPA